MKKYLVIALLAVGCASSAPPPVVTTPTPVAAPEATTNTYAGVVGFLKDLTTVTPEQFAAVCSEAGGNLTVDDQGFHVCSKDNAGFSIQILSDGTVKGSSILVPPSEGEALAKALVAELGQPSFVEANAAGWDLGDAVIVFAPVDDVAYIVVYEKSGTSL